MYSSSSSAHLACLRISRKVDLRADPMLSSSSIFSNWPARATRRLPSIANSAHHLLFATLKPATFSEIRVRESSRGIWGSRFYDRWERLGQIGDLWIVCWLFKFSLIRTVNSAQKKSCCSVSCILHTQTNSGSYSSGESVVTMRCLHLLSIRQQNGLRTNESV